ncbi:MAG TPA: metallophosphoesterase [Tepidisphaeraceae bacterium]|nr:metallophosphoesterase [Tepidisphaeraceae bacterium]
MSTNGKDTIRVAALGDLHCSVDHRGQLAPLFQQIAEAADIMVLCGDLTDFGQPDEAHVLAKELSSAAKIPTVGVLGNHDYESGHADEVRKILMDTGIHLLDGEAFQIQGVGFAGVKGFGGGFGRGTLSAFGESGIKQFVQEALNESMKLEAALQRLRTPHRIAVLHYSPIRGTVEGEPEQIFPFLGCSRLEEPLNRYQVTTCVHGHAHRGAAEGKTTAGVPVYNVGIPVMRSNFPNRPPFRLLTLSAVPAAQQQQHPAVQVIGATQERVVETPVEASTPRA